MSERRRVLNVGGSSKEIPIPDRYNDWEHLLLDIDARPGVDVVADARNLAELEAAQFDAIYCSHTLEHFYRHDVPKVLKGFFHVLKPEGFVEARVPDMMAVMTATVNRNLDIDDVLYQSPAGPITVRDVFYGYGVEIERSGNDFFAHKTGFSDLSMRRILAENGFPLVMMQKANLELLFVAFKSQPAEFARALFKLAPAE
jgi:SAM-dependent methyltransferase